MSLKTFLKQAGSWIIPAACLFIFSYPAGAASAGEGGDSRSIVSALQNTVMVQEIYRERQWTALLHYRPGADASEGSVIDDPAFFLSPEGKHSAQAELLATLEAFYADEVPEIPEVPEGPDVTKGGEIAEVKKPGQHALCRYPARLRWLTRRLGIDPGTMPHPECPELEIYLSKLDPQRATLVFPESHINSPASMFGHTLLRIDSAYESALLSYAINYAAHTSETFGPTYAVKGLFGMYRGYYSVNPYYEKIRTYGKIENRDIWEYELTLTQEEVTMLALHVWELREIYSRYYFLDENCSYNLLFLLEVARPQLSLTGGDPLFVVPVDTVRTLNRQGVLKPAEYRPSKATWIEHVARLSSEEEQELAISVARGDAPASHVQSAFPHSPDAQRRTLDLSGAYLQVLASKNRLQEDEYKPRLLDILRQRSALASHTYEVPQSTSPEQGHLTSSFAAGIQFSEHQRQRLLLQYKPSYHDVLDPSPGYKKGAAISFFDLMIGVSPETQRVTLEHAMLLNILSLAPSDRFFSPVSWKVRAGLQRIRLGKDSDRTVALLNPGGGKAFEMAGGYVFGLLESELQAGHSLTDSYALGGGASLGWLGQVGASSILYARVRAMRFVMGEVFDDREAEAALSVRLGQNQSLVLSVHVADTDGFRDADARVMLRHFF